MRVIILGSGNVATVLGRTIKSSGHDVLQVYSRNILKAELLANEFVAEAIDELGNLNMDADIYLVALSDSAIVKVVKNIHLQKGILVHTAGGVAKNILENAAVDYGVLYPLQSLRKEKTDYQNIPFLVDGNSAKVISTIALFAKTISSLVEKANDEERLKLHIAAVVVSNFTNYLYALADDYCQKENIPFKMLQPIIEEVSNRLQNHHAVEMQTGPAIRKDLVTIQKHIGLLNNYPDLKEVYSFLTNKIMNM